MINRSRVRARRAKEGAFWLDQLPKEVRENVARVVTNGGHCTDDGLHLSRTSKLQRRAVLAAMPKHMDFVLEALDLTEEWAKLLAGHIFSVRVEVFDAADLDAEDYKDSPLLRLLSAPQLQKAHIPGISAFLAAVRSSKSLRSLTVDMCLCAHQSLLLSLRQLGPSLSFLTLMCGNADSPTEQTSLPRCPMLLCNASSSSNIGGLCPNLTHLSITCPHMQPSIVSSVIYRLPSLLCVEVISPGETIALSEEDLVALAGLESVCVENVSGGLEVAGRIGSAITGVSCLVEDNLDAPLELLKCPRVRTARLRISLKELTRFTNVVAKLPMLRSLTFAIRGHHHERKVTFEEIRYAALQAKMILRKCTFPVLTVLLDCAVFPNVWMARSTEMAKISDLVADERTEFSYTEVSVHLMPYMRVALSKAAAK